MSLARFPPPLPDVRRHIAAGQVEAAIWTMINCHWTWQRWLTADELNIVRAAGCPGWVIGDDKAS